MTDSTWNRCPHTVVTSRNVPIEYVHADAAQHRRVAGASFLTCQACGASFYSADVLAQPGAAVVPQATPQDDLCDC